MTIVALRRVGIDEAFVAQAAEDEEAEFQRAFGVELAVGLVASLAIALLAPVLAAVYGDDRLLALTLGVAYLPVAFSLQAPQWVFFRRMDFLRLRLLQAIVPLGTVIVTVPLLLAGVGVWALVIGPFCGHAAAVLAAAVASPYRLRPRFERAAARRYLRFSWPVFATAVAALAVAQGQVALFGLSEDGLAAAGWITLAATLTRYADRADQIVATTIYPAIVRVRDRTAVLEELFAKSNRLTLMWAFPFGAGLALFGGDLVAFVLGDEWEPAVVLLGGLAVATALQQLGYNWFAFYRARGESRPQAVESAAFAGSFALLAVPATLAWGSWGFVAGRLACTVCVLAVRRAYVLRLLPGVRLGEIARAGGAAGAGGDGARAGAAARAVGRRAAAVAGAGRAGAVGGRARARHAPARVRAAARAVGLPAAGRRAAVVGRRRGGPAVRRAALLWLAAAADLGLHDAALPRALRRGAAAAGRGADRGRAVAVRGLRLALRARAAARWWRGCRASSTRRWRGGGCCGWPPTRPRRWRCGALVRREAGARWALAAWLAAAVTVAQPTSANPFPVALAFALCAVLAAARGRPVPAGLLAALAAFWRPDIGAVAGVAAVAALLAGGAAGAAARARTRRALLAAAAAVLGGALLYLPFAVAAGPGAAVGRAGRHRGRRRRPVAAAVPARLRRAAARLAAVGAGRGPQGRARLLPAARGARARRGRAASLLRAAPAAAPPELAGVLVLAAGCALYLLSRPGRPARAAARRVPVRGDPARGRRARRAGRSRARARRPGSG